MEVPDLRDMFMIMRQRSFVNQISSKYGKFELPHAPKKPFRKKRSYL